MGKDTRKAIVIHADIEEFGTAEAFVENALNRASISREIAYEALLVF